MERLLEAIGLGLLVYLAIRGLGFIITERVKHAVLSELTKPKPELIEAWLCPHCNRPSRFSPTCEWCDTPKPENIQAVTLTEEQFSREQSRPA